MDERFRKKKKVDKQRRREQRGSRTEQLATGNARQHSSRDVAERTLPLLYSSTQMRMLLHKRVHAQPTSYCFVLLLQRLPFIFPFLFFSLHAASTGLFLNAPIVGRGLVLLVEEDGRRADADEDNRDLGDVPDDGLHLLGRVDLRLLLLEHEHRGESGGAKGGGLSACFVKVRQSTQHPTVCTSKCVST